jgi:hypothetical protein
MREHTCKLPTGYRVKPCRIVEKLDRGHGIGTSFREEDKDELDRLTLCYRISHQIKMTKSRQRLTLSLILK